MSKEALEDACALLDNYIETTNRIVRCEGNGPSYTYPQGANELDMLAFAAVFANVWQAIVDKTVFAGHYATKTAPFAHLVELTKPDATFHPYTCFWEQNGVTLSKADATTEAGMHSLCRTLRNGFGHFNYRYLDASPDDYFKRLGVPTPAGIQDPAKAVNYRIFICDHAPHTKIMASRSNTRILETGFGHIRFHLYAFLEQFFKVECGRAEVSLMNLGR